MAGKYAALLISERVDEAVKLLGENPSLSVRKTATICNIHHYSASRRCQSLIQSKKKADQEHQLLTPIKKAILIKYALKYNVWGLSLQFKHLP